MGRGSSKAGGSSASGSNVRETAQDFIKRVVSSENMVVRITANDMLPIVGTRDDVLKRLNANKDNLYVRKMVIEGFNNMTIECVYSRYK